MAEEKTNILKKVKRKDGKHGKVYYIGGKIISRKKYWEMKLKDLVKKNSIFNLNITFSKSDQKKLLIMQKIWDVDTPSNLIKLLLNKYFAEVSLVKFQKELEKYKKDIKKEE